ncbi:uncharacterized protein I206_101913 [Kwoniella pini CBS 10737]|uniref:Phosphatidate cytidylyltransferase, mitochondrial n=1 Tax=Kwoniella pini CBS 10737 TaxID=1296096 RepID=A0A1B9HVD1_9TREE|nr:uncharacterized protein I206_06996 [Kwoniella pini CBS 10737]OCF47218.1 hypothetical protein I206_06996 [Kwoniella pini CBS 10737]
MALQLSKPLSLALRSSSSLALVSSSSRTKLPFTLSPLINITSNAQLRSRNRSQAVHIRINVRNLVSDAQKPKGLPSDQQASYNQLRPLIDTFEAPIDWAVAYGSGVMKQAQTKPGDSPSLVDLLLSTSSPIDFHTINLRQNPSHYPLHARLIGAKGISHIQENWGANVWYVTNVKIGNTSVKYGIISNSSLIQDLNEWKTFYLSGRLQKPTLPLILSNSSLNELNQAIKKNLKSALCFGLLLCPKEFKEDYLWEKITGLSYSGDPRMSIPGGENPEKIKNIVRGLGAREGFRNMYEPFLKELGIGFLEDKDKKEDKFKNGWKGEGESLLYQPNSTEYQIQLFNSLPLSLRHSVLSHFPNVSNQQSEKEELLTKIKDPKFIPTISSELRNIIHKPALRQSIKGLFTAGFTKSFWYALAKIQKWFKGRAKK